jgi:RNA polymerase sigma-70 factor (ECF subfamily)
MKQGADQVILVSKRSCDENRRKRNVFVEEIFRKHNEALVSFLRVKLRSEQEAREVAQETYAKLLSIDSDKRVSFFRAYLFKIANNLAIDRMRQQGRAYAHQTFLRHQTIEQEPSAEEVAAVIEKVEMIRLYLNELPPKCREAFMMRRIQRMSVSEIANVLQVTDRSVRNYLRRALQHCRNRLDSDLVRE